MKAKKLDKIKTHSNQSINHPTNNQLSLQGRDSISTFLFKFNSCTTKLTFPLKLIATTLLNNQLLFQGPDSDGIRNATSNSTETTTSKYTGIPQKDYIYDPNLPRELNGYNLSSYPFLSLVPPPEQMSFKCDGLHDGFYADTEFKCQV